MTKDWVHGVGHSPVCQILLQIVVRAVIHPLHQATHDDIRRSYLKTPQTRDGDTPEVSKALAEDDDKTLQTDKTGHL